jgi:hypothetical protein
MNGFAAFETFLDLANKRVNCRGRLGGRQPIARHGARQFRLRHRRRWCHHRAGGNNNGDRARRYQFTHVQASPVSC